MTKLEQKLLALSKKDYPLTRTQKNWIIHCLSSEGYKGGYYQIWRTIQGYRVLLTYKALASNKSYTCMRFILLAMRIEENKRIAIVCRPRTLGCYIDTFSYSSPMRVKKSYAYEWVSKEGFVPIPKIGIRKGGEYAVSFFHDNIECEYRDSKAETLYKNPLTKPILQWLSSSGSSVPKYLFEALKIVIRNKYQIIDTHSYLEYLKLIHKLKLDHRNKIFVCPDNLEEARSIAIHKSDNKKLKEQERLRLRAEKAQLLRDTKEMDKTPEYLKRVGKLIGVVFGNEHLQFHVLQSIQEFYDEGKSMNHCVFRNQYYNKQNYIILSCRDNNGNRIETAEIDTKNLSIVQSRGVSNRPSSYHEEVLALLQANLYLFKTKHYDNSRLNANRARV